MKTKTLESHLCKICSAPAKIAYQISRFDLFICPSCSHFFSHVKENPEDYKGHYFFDHKKEYFEHPDEKLFFRLHQLIERFHPSKKGSRRLLDVGTAVGTIPQYFNRLGYESHGIDISVEAIRYGTETLKIPNLEAVAIEDYHPASAFDVVICNNVIEHVPDPVRLSREMRRVLSDDGILLCVTVDSKSLIFSLAKFLFRITNGAFYKPLARVCDVHHLHHFNQASLERALNESGFKVVDRFGWDLPLNSITLSPLQKAAVGAMYGASAILNSHFLQGVVCVKK